MPMISLEPLETPFIVLIDSREQKPYSFADLVADAKQDCRPLVVRQEVIALASGDYSLDPFQARVGIERKSCEDLFATLGQGRDRFERELERLAAYDFAAVVVEAEWSQILDSPPEHSQLAPKTVYRSVIAWQQRYPRIHWWFVAGRRMGEVTTFRLLERFWREHAHEA